MSPKILVLGPPRTGTQTTLAALDELGFHESYHMRNVAVSGHVEAWCDLLESRFGEETTVNVNAGLREILDRVDAVADFPATIFATELIDLYPHAQLILSTRDEDAWVSSMNRTLVGGHTKPDVNKSRPTYPLAEKYHSYCWKDDFATNGRSFWRDHNAAVRRAAEAQSRPLLVFDVKDGWQPLCDFLGLPVPSVPFPNVDEARPAKKEQSSESIA